MLNKIRKNIFFIEPGWGFGHFSNRKKKEEEGRGVTVKRREWMRGQEIERQRKKRNGRKEPKKWQEREKGIKKTRKEGYRTECEGQMGKEDHRDNRGRRVERRREKGEGRRDK
jgi:hypothetical protein